MMTFGDVGQDDDVRDPAKASHGLHRSGDRRLAVHLRLEKAQQQFPDQRPLHRLPAVLVAQRLAEAAVVHVEMDVMRSEARRVGKECVSTCSSRWSPYP